MPGIQAAYLIRSGLFVAYIFISGCTSLQSDALLRSENTFPDYIELTEVPFFAQAQYQCGPASLAMMLQAANINVTPDELVPQVYLPNREGSLQIEMLAAARRQNVIPYTLHKTMHDLLAEVNAQHPVLILQNLGLSWLPKWHYAVVVGFDLENAEIILRSGMEFRHVVPMKVFERTWARAGYWAVVILPANELPHTADEISYIETVSKFERDKKYNVSKIAYKTALTRWPDSVTALMGLGNSYYALEEFHQAAATFQYITAVHNTEADAFNNLADTLGQLQRFDEALTAARQAVQLGGKYIAIYRQTLAELEQAADVARSGK